MDGVEVHAPRRDRVREVEFVSGKGLQAAEYGVEPGELAVAAGGGHVRIAELMASTNCLARKYHKPSISDSSGAAGSKSVERKEGDFRGRVHSGKAETFFVESHGPREISSTESDHADPGLRLLLSPPHQR